MCPVAPSKNHQCGTANKHKVQSRLILVYLQEWPSLRLQETLKCGSLSPQETSTSTLIRGSQAAPRQSWSHGQAGCLIQTFARYSGGGPSTCLHTFAQRYPPSGDAGQSWQRANWFLKLVGLATGTGRQRPYVLIEAWWGCFCSAFLRLDSTWWIRTDLDRIHEKRSAWLVCVRAIS